MEALLHRWPRPRPRRAAAGRGGTCLRTPPPMLQHYSRAACKTACRSWRAKFKGSGKRHLRQPQRSPQLQGCCPAPTRVVVRHATLWCPASRSTTPTGQRHAVQRGVRLRAITHHTQGWCSFRKLGTLVSDEIISFSWSLYSLLAPGCATEARAFFARTVVSRIQIRAVWLCMGRIS